SAGMLNLANAAYFAVFVLWAVDTIGVPAARYGLIMTALAVGVVAGSLLSDRLAVRLGERELLVGGWLINCLLLLVPVLVPVEWPLYPTMVAMGATGGAVNVLVISTRQRLIPAGMLGRVNSVYRLIGMGGMPVGAALGGFVGELGLPIVFVGAVGVCLAAVGLIWWTTRHGISGSLTSKSILPDISRSR
ncbi:MAG: MFS transporter, partial [Nonomuraea sp.]|nr:MFS transporter [Nonomuraea sp.]